MGVVTGMRRMATQRGLKGEQRKEMTTVCRYLENNAERMRYQEYLQAGYPIASGVIEGACRHTSRTAWNKAGCAGRYLELRRCSTSSHLHSSEWTAFHSWRQSENRKTTHRNSDLVANYAGFKA